MADHVSEPVADDRADARADDRADNRADNSVETRIEIRPLETIAQIHEAADVLRDVWAGDRDAMPPNLMRALAHSGNYVVGMYDSGRMIGASIAFFAPPSARSMHSHITGVLPGSFALSSQCLHEMHPVPAA
jgi:hypothetical protein